MVPVGQHCVWVSPSGWVGPVSVFLELGVSHRSCWQASLFATFVGDSVARENPQRQWGECSFETLEPNRCGHGVEEVVTGSAAFLTRELQMLAAQWHGLCQWLSAIRGLCKKTTASKFSLVTHACNHSTQEEEAGEPRHLSYVWSSRPTWAK